MLRKVSLIFLSLKPNVREALQMLTHPDADELCVKIQFLRIALWMYLFVPSRLC